MTCPWIWPVMSSWNIESGWNTQRGRKWNLKIEQVEREREKGSRRGGGGLERDSMNGVVAGVATIARQTRAGRKEAWGLNGNLWYKMPSPPPQTRRFSPVCRRYSLISGHLGFSLTNSARVHHRTQPQTGFAKAFSAFEQLSSSSFSNFLRTWEY